MLLTQKNSRTRILQVHKSSHEKQWCLQKNLKKVTLVSWSVHETIGKVSKNVSKLQEKGSEFTLVDCAEKQKAWPLDLCRDQTLYVKRPNVWLKEDIALPWSTNFHANYDDSQASELSSFEPSLIASDVKTFEGVCVSSRSSEDEHEVSEWTASPGLDGLGIDQDENECIQSLSDNVFSKFLRQCVLSATNSGCILTRRVINTAPDNSTVLWLHFGSATHNTVILHPETSPVENKQAAEKRSNTVQQHSAAQEPSAAARRNSKAQQHSTAAQHSNTTQQHGAAQQPSAAPQLNSTAQQTSESFWSGKPDPASTPTAERTMLGEVTGGSLDVKGSKKYLDQDIDCRKLHIASHSFQITQFRLVMWQFLGTLEKQCLLQRMPLSSTCL
jgi:hypothetical protein